MLHRTNQKGIKKSIKEHIFNLKQPSEKHSVPTKHINVNNYSFDSNNVTILDSEIHNYAKLMYVMLHIISNCLFNNVKTIRTICINNEIMPFLNYICIKFCSYFIAAPSPPPQT